MKKALLITIYLLLITTAALAVPSQINFQGVLKNNSGALLNSETSMTFIIYDGPGSGATNLWIENHPLVTVEAGLYSVQLGSYNPLTSSIFDGNPKYVGVTVGNNGTEITPRTILISAAYALSAQAIDGKDVVILGPDSIQSTSLPNGISVSSSLLPAGSGILSTGETYGIYGNSTTGTAIRGDSTGLYGVWGSSTSGAGISAESGGAGHGIYALATTSYSGYFTGGSGVNIQGPITLISAEKNSNYQITNQDGVLFVGTSGGAVTITLPAASSSTIGRVFYVYLSECSVLPVNAVTVGGSGADTINGTATTSTQYQCIRVIGYTSTSWIANVY